MSDSELERYVKLKRRAPRRDFLDAVDATRRELVLLLESDELLRIGDNRPQRRRMQALAAQLRAQVREQLQALRRRAFRGPVSVELDLHAVDVEQPATSPPAVKAYLDLLQGLVYPDDSSIGHLRVTRHAADHPILRAWPEDWLYLRDARFPHGPSGRVEVRMRVLPLRAYVADYDRAFRLRDKVFKERERWEWDDDDDRPGARFWSDRWDDFRDDEKLSELRAEHRADLAGRGPLYGPGGLYDGNQEMADLRLAERRRREGEIRTLLNRLLLDQRPGKLDRPGQAPELDELLWSRAPGLAEITRVEAALPGSFFLPLPPQTSHMANWKMTVRSRIEEHRRKWPVVSEPLDTALALDIAVRGAGANQRDLDNLAHDVLGPFEELYCANRRGTVVSYRVYAAESPRAEVRVLVMADERLHQLEEAIATCRQWVLVHGPQDSD